MAPRFDIIVFAERHAKYLGIQIQGVSIDEAYSHSENGHSSVSGTFKSSVVWSQERKNSMGE